MEAVVRAVEDDVDASPPGVLCREAPIVGGHLRDRRPEESRRGVGYSVAHRVIASGSLSSK